jgi:hypothetical protein
MKILKKKEKLTITSIMISNNRVHLAKIQIEEEELVQVLRDKK